MKSNFSKKILPCIILVLYIAYNYFFNFVPINIKSEELWGLIIKCLIFVAIWNFFATRIKDSNKTKEKFVNFDKTRGSFNFNFNKGEIKKEIKNSNKSFKMPLIILGIVIGLLIVIQLASSEIFHAKKYSQILPLEDAKFKDVIDESDDTSYIALMDTQSAKQLGNRKIGSLSKVVSQYDVSNSYTQINYHNKPMKVSPLGYTGFFKWKNNRKNGIPGYVIVDPVDMSAEYIKSDSKMKIVPTGYFFEYSRRYIYMHYPTKLLGNSHFEIDENGNPYYITPCYDNTIGLFGGTTVIGAVILNPCDGEINYYDVKDVPDWVDLVFDGSLLSEQYNYYGNLSNGYFNSIFSQKGCKVATDDYGYIAKDKDIWIYTGVTSIKSDSSNIGFLIANERTGKAKFFEVSGADEASAMNAAEGEVQEKGYDASFPSLINISGCPTYIMVLKDNSGIVKQFAAVNVEQYNVVAVANTQKECLEKYRNLILKDDSIDTDNNKKTENEVKDIIINRIEFISEDGDTTVYIVDTDNNIYTAAFRKDYLLYKTGDKLSIEVDNNNVIKEIK